jgi:phage-related protein
MADEQEWSIVFYTTEQGGRLVEEFLGSLDLKTKARLLYSINLLKELNVRATEPMVKHIEGKLWELRRSSNGNIFRVMYFFFTGKRIVFVHGFQKKTQKTPKREIEIAEKRMNDFIKRAGGE